MPYLRPAAACLSRLRLVKAGLTACTGVAISFVSMSAFAWPASIVRVVDGDTFVAVNQASGETISVQLAGIDAPEIAEGTGRPGQPGGPAALDGLRQFLSMTPVHVQDLGVGPGGTRYGIVRSAAGDVSRAMVFSGLAWDCPSGCAGADYAMEVHPAQRDSRGVWASGQAVPPWEWRRLHWVD